MVRGDVLQIVAFTVLFAMAVSAMGQKAAPILRGCEALSQVMFKFTNYVMMFAPIGVGAAMAHTIATNGLTVLWNLGKFDRLALPGAFHPGGVCLWRGHDYCAGADASVLESGA